MKQFPSKISELLCKGISHVELTDWCLVIDFYTNHHQELDEWQLGVIKRLNVQYLNHFNKSTWSVQTFPREGKPPKVQMQKKVGLMIKPEEIQPQSILDDVRHLIEPLKEVKNDTRNKEK